MDHTQLIILILIGLISFIQWVMKKAGELRAQRELKRQADHGVTEPEPPTPVFQREVVRDESSDESMRKLMDALGLPQDTPPPIIPPRRVEPVPVAPEPPPLKTWVAPAAKRSESFPARRSGPMPASAPKAESRFRALLGSRDGLRNAMVLSEILGPPKSLRRDGDSLI